MAKAAPIESIFSVSQTVGIGACARNKWKKQEHQKNACILLICITPAYNPCLCFRDVCKSELKQCSIAAAMWEDLAEDRTSWRTTTKSSLREAEQSINTVIITAKRFKVERSTVPASIIQLYLCHLPMGLPLAGWAVQPHSQVQMSRYYSYSTISFRRKEAKYITFPPWLISRGSSSKIFHAKVSQSLHRSFKSTKAISS